MDHVPTSYSVPVMKVLKCLKHLDSCLKCCRACMIGIIRQFLRRRCLSGHYSTQEVIFSVDAVHTVRVPFLFVNRYLTLWQILCSGLVDPPKTGTAGPACPMTKAGLGIMFYLWCSRYFVAHVKFSILNCRERMNVGQDLPTSTIKPESSTLPSTVFMGWSAHQLLGFQLRLTLVSFKPAGNSLNFPSSKTTTPVVPLV